MKKFDSKGKLFLITTALFVSVNLVSESLIEEVVVTAEKRAASLQDVSKSVTALTEEELEDWGEKNAKNRKIVFTTQMKNVVEVLQKGVTTYPDIAVCNFMKAKHGYSKSYEDFEKLNTKSISPNSLRRGWSLAKRIDNPGTEVSWTHFTVDWFDKYSDFLKARSGPSSDWASDANYKKFMKLRDLTHTVVFRKFIFLNKE